MVRLADEYQFITVKRDTENQLIKLMSHPRSRAEYTDLEYLIMAEKYSMPQLKVSLFEIGPVATDLTHRFCWLIESAYFQEHAFLNIFRNNLPPPGSNMPPSQFNLMHVIQNDPNYDKMSSNLKVMMLDRIRSHHFNLPYFGPPVYNQ